MESLQLEDLSLFNGDLLSVGLSATAPLSAATDVECLLSPDNSSSLLGLQDGSLWPAPLELVDPVKTMAGATSDSLVTELLDSSSTAVTVAGEELPLDNTSWMDTNVDLMQFLGSNEVEAQVLPAAPLQVPLASSPVTTQSSAAQLLENFGQPSQQPQQLSAEASPIPSPTPSPGPLQASPTPSQETSGAQAVDMLEVLSKLTEAMDGNLEDLEQPGLELSYEPILSPMSAEEVESILSEPTSPGSSSVLEDSGFVDESVAETIDLSQLEELPRIQKASPGPQKRATIEKSRNAPYTKQTSTRESKAQERKLRKKQQNKDAALRYRQKKKAECNKELTECEKLENRNKELREKVDSMTREIDYLKSLMAEVYKAKGLIMTTKK